MTSTARLRIRAPRARIPRAPRAPILRAPIPLRPRAFRAALALVPVLALGWPAPLWGQEVPERPQEPWTEGRRAPLLVAHRGASAYAPEHTAEAYRLALAQGAHVLEPDLQITRDGVLICLHDLTLERTTNVREVFPDRFREIEVGGTIVRRWYAADFTLDELRQLDAGQWFGPEFTGARIPTLEELIEIARGRAGIFPEIKSPEFYHDRGVDPERLLIDILARNGLLETGADPATPVFIQSFSPESLRRLRMEFMVELPLTLLIGNAAGAGTWLSDEGLDRAKEFVDGIGPSKGLVLADPDVVRRAQTRGLTVIPYTFRSGNTGAFPDVTEEMAHFLFTLGVDGVFTDNPDLFPRPAERR